MVVQVQEPDFESLAVLAFLVMVCGLFLIAGLLWLGLRVYYYMREQHYKRVYRIKHESLKETIELAKGETEYHG